MERVIRIQSHSLILCCAERRDIFAHRHYVEELADFDWGSGTLDWYGERRRVRGNNHRNQCRCCASEYVVLANALKWAFLGFWFWCGSFLGHNRGVLRVFLKWHTGRHGGMRRAVCWGRFPGSS